jgi:hypothetical protein
MSAGLKWAGGSRSQEERNNDNKHATTGSIKHSADIPLEH